MSERVMVRIGWTLTGLFAAFILVASVAPKLIGAAAATETLAALGWPVRYTLPIGLLELGCLALYLYRRTSVLGAVLFTGLLGGAMATQIRIGNPLFSHVLFGLYLGLFLWGGLWLRTPALRALFPYRREGGR
jgi:hypothetical protein